MKLRVTQLCPTLCDPMNYTVHGILQARILEWVAFPFSRGSSQPRESNPGLLHCRWILYQLSLKRSPRILEWVAYPFSRGSSWPKDQTQVSRIAGVFFISSATREVLYIVVCMHQSQSASLSLLLLLRLLCYLILTRILLRKLLFIWEKKAKKIKCNSSNQGHRTSK